MNTFKVAFFLMCPVAGFWLLGLLVIVLNSPAAPTAEDAMRFMLWVLLIPVVLGGTKAFCQFDSMSDKLGMFFLMIAWGGLGAFFFLYGLSAAGIMRALLLLVSSVILLAFGWMGTTLCLDMMLLILANTFLVSEPKVSEHGTVLGRMQAQKTGAWTIVGVVASVVGMIIGFLQWLY